MSITKTRVLSEDLLSSDHPTVAYLSGGMEYKTNLGATWRSWITDRLDTIGIGVMDPVKIELSEDDVPAQARLTQLKLAGKLDQVRDITRKALFRKDMWGIQVSHIMILFYDHSVQKGAGTLSEAWEAFREGKPVYVVTEFPLEKIPTWLIGETTQLFSDFDGLLEYLADPIQIKKDMEGAQKISKEVLGEIY